MLHCLHHTYSSGTRQRAREVFTIFFHFSTDGGRSTVCGTRASLTSLRTRSFKMLDDFGDHEIRDSCEYLGAASDTPLNGAYDFDSGVKDFSVQTTVSMRSAIFFPEDFFCVLRGTQRTLTSNRWSPGTGQGTNGTMASVPLWVRTALQSAELAFCACFSPEAQGTGFS